MTVMEELISVIIPVHNIENYLPRCLRAISEQTYRNLEIILVDDGSTDRSGSLCDDFAAKDPRARVIHQSNAGLWAARNTGHDAARGEYLWFPDGDDYFHRDFLRILYEAIRSGSGYDMAICQRKQTARADEDVSSSPSVQLTIVSQEVLFQCLFLKYSGPLNITFSHVVWNKLFRRHLIDNLRHNPYPVAEDRDFLMRLYLKVNEAVLVDNALYYWVQRPSSITHFPTYPLTNRECVVKMSFRNLSGLPEEGKKFRHFFLDELYTNLVFWQALAWKTEAFHAARTESKEIIRQSIDTYYHCRKIPFWKRVACLFLVEFPCISHWLIKISGN